MKYIDGCLNEIVNKKQWAAHHRVSFKTNSEFSRIFDQPFCLFIVVVFIKAIALVKEFVKYQMKDGFCMKVSGGQLKYFKMRKITN